VRVQGRERLRGAFGDEAAAALDAQLAKVRAVILFILTHALLTCIHTACKISALGWRSGDAPALRLCSS
jgi:hypothetical protein